MISLAAAWCAFLGWMILAPRALRWEWVALLTPGISLVFLQFTSGIIHEAAHGNLVRGNRVWNERIGNFFASYLFLYTLESYRRGHFDHHRNSRFLTEVDLETGPYATTRVHAWLGVVSDLTFRTAMRAFFFRTGATAATGNAVNAWPRVLAHAFCLWSLVAILGHPMMPPLFVLTFLTVYPLSNRIRTWATHGDLRAESGLTDSPVSRNVLAPAFERIFFGNRMMMYHHEHHHAPELPFRECERRAYARHAALVGASAAELANVETRSYLACVWAELSVGRGAEGRPAGT